MHCCNVVGAIVVTTLTMTIGGVQAADSPKYPDWRGAWARFVVPGLGGQPSFDQIKPWGFGQQAPLTPEYQKVLEESIADQAHGGQGNWHTGAECLPPGMPAMMTLYRPMEIVVLPEITYILIEHVMDSHRRIYTDGRDWPKEVEASFLGYS